MLDFFRVTPKKRTVKIKKGGVIFHNPPWFMKIVFWGGNVLVLIAVMYGVYLYYPLGRAIVNYKLNERVEPGPPVAIYPTPTVMVIEGEVDKTYEIQIPKILARAEIISNVSPFNPVEYLKVLKTNVIAQAKGTAMPGDGIGKSVYIFAHSTNQGIGMARNNAVFYLLGELKAGDLVFVRYQGEGYTYRVYDQKVIAASEIKYLNYSDPEKEVLILQTCWPIGTDWKRLLVFAQKV